MAFSTPKRFMPSTLSDSECIRRIGTAYSVKFPWEHVVSPNLKSWLNLVARSRKCRPEYILLASLPTISALCGSKTVIEISTGFHEERLNCFMCILGDSGASKYMFAA